MILLCVNIMLLALGTLMDMAPLILILTPILLPVMKTIGVDPVHFGMIMMVNLGIGLITPPVGMNLFIINSMDKETPMTDTYKTVMFFVGSDIVRVIILVAFPSITLFLLS